MFKEIFSFELRQGFRRPTVYIFFGFFLLIGLLSGFAVSGVFNTTSSDSNTIYNSAYEIAGLINGMGLLNNIILVAIMATAIYKDYQYNTHPLFFTKPISKASYFFGRFMGAYVLGLFVMSGILIGYLFGILPGIGKPNFGSIDLVNFVQPFLIFTMPNVLLMGIILFSLTTFTRSTLSAYLFCIILVILNIITGNMASDLEKKDLAALLEPFGSLAFNNITEYWTPAEKNTRLIPLKGVLLNNRLLWTGIALLITFVSYNRFSFSQFLSPLKWFKRKYDESPATSEVLTIADMPAVTQNYSGKYSLQQLWYLAKFEFKKIAQSTFFIVICILTLSLIIAISYFSNNAYESAMQPLTYTAIGMARAYYGLASIFIVFFSGTIIFREREAKVDELVHTTPVSNTVLFFSKFFGLMAVIIVLQTIAVLAGIGIQLSRGFYQIDIWQYIVAFYVFDLLTLSIVIGICLAIQVFSSNKYLGFFLSLIPIMGLAIIFGLLQWDDNLYHFNSTGPRLPYSDLNGFGPVLPRFLFNGYWLSFVLIIAFIALMFYARGKESKFVSRFKFSKKEFTKGNALALGLAIVGFLSFGAIIFYNTHILNKYRSSKEEVKQLVEYEKQYKKYENTPQPRIVSSNVDVDIFPEEGKLHVKGFYWLKNKNDIPVDTVYINVFDETSNFKYKILALDKDAKLIVDDMKNGVKIFKLSQALQPGDSTMLSFEFDYAPQGFSNNSVSSLVIKNGTFFNNSIMPSLGYNEQGELSSNKERKKFGLSSRARMANIDDSLALRNTYISNDADWIRFETKVSTSADQIAIAPGYLVKEETIGNRKTFHYKMDSPMLNFYAYQSAKYQVKRDKWNDVNIEIYYDKAHPYNVDNMILAVKKSLEYYSQNFSPYQHRQLRIIEFPRVAAFAQSFANTIPFSETIGFTNKVDTSDWTKIDLPFYITAHEVAHQWWAHQVIGGNVQGSTLLSETMSQYSALMVMEKRYGADNMKKFLKYEMDNYLQSRTVEGKGERPLLYVENQQYIHYQKGSVIMYALKDYLGEEVLNAALRKYISKVAFQNPPYTNALEFIGFIRDATPDSLKYIIHDMFEKITVYENYVKALKYTPTNDGKYKVTLTVGSAKFYSDSMGNNTKATVNDYIDIGVFGIPEKGSRKEYKPLVFQRIKMDAPEKTFEFIVSEKPLSAGIDPYNKLIDRTPDNNLSKFGIMPKIPNLSEKEMRFNFSTED